MLLITIKKILCQNIFAFWNARSPIMMKKVPENTQFRYEVRNDPYTTINKVTRYNTDAMRLMKTCEFFHASSAMKFLVRAKSKSWWVG